MSEKRPNVFQTQNDVKKTADESAYFRPINVDPNLDLDEQEKIRTAEQKVMRDEAMRKTLEMASEGEQLRKAMSEQPDNNKQTYQATTPPVSPPIIPPSNDDDDDDDYEDEELKKEERARLIEVLSQPQMNQPYDLIPLPSEGKLYSNNKKSVKVAYLTTADENILTSPNLVESGDFLEILINRKLLEPTLRYKDLIPGDRNAIMIWLRATGYGEMYPITIYDNDGEPFDTEINLSTLKTIKLSVEPEEDGLYTFILPVSKNKVRFRVLTIGEIEELEAEAEDRKDEIINSELSMILESQIVSVNDNNDRAYISNFVENMRILDAKKLREYIGSINCGIDMAISVQTPKGDTVNTFLPLTTKFFWPDFEI
jgi:hypothetical protein